jgi:hypothetical protein
VSALELRFTSNGGLGFSIFSKPSYFCMWKFVSIYKSQFVLSAETKFHTQKCNTPNSPNYKFYNGTVNLLVELNRCIELNNSREGLESRVSLCGRLSLPRHRPRPRPRPRPTVHSLPAPTGVERSLDSLPGPDYR